MTTESLEDFLREKKKKNDGDGIDWQARLSLWKSKVEELYNHIKEWLQTLKDEGVLDISFESLLLSEDFLGEYNINVMHLKVGSERVYLRPKGTLVVSAFGRVDMSGDEGRVMLVLLGPTEESGETTDVQERMKRAEWHLTDRDRRRSTVPLTKETFSEAIKLVMRK